MILSLSKWSFLLLIFSLPLIRPFNTDLFGLQVPYTDFIFLASSGFWALAVLRKETLVRSDRLFIFIGLYALTFVISTILSVDPKTSFFKLLGEFYLFSLCFLTFNLIDNVEFLRRVIIAWLGGTVLTIVSFLAGIVLFYVGYKTKNDNYFLSHLGSLPAGDYPRIRALFENANMLCNFLNVSIVLTLLAEKLGWIKKRAAIVLAVGILAAALFSISPGIGGIALTLGIWFGVKFSKISGRRLAIPALVFGTAISLAVFGSTLVSPDTNNTSQDINVPVIDKIVEPSVRVLVWQDTVQTIRQFPWLGKGTGMDVAHIEYVTLSGDKQDLYDAHNMWLNVAGQTGLIGLTAFLILLIYLFKRCSFKIKEGIDGEYIHLALSCALVGAFFYQGLAGSYEDTRHIWVLIGILAAYSVPASMASKNDILTVPKMP